MTGRSRCLRRIAKPKCKVHTECAINCTFVAALFCNWFPPSHYDSWPIQGRHINTLFQTMKCQNNMNLKLNSAYNAAFNGFCSCTSIIMNLAFNNHVLWQFVRISIWLVEENTSTTDISQSVYSADEAVF